MLIKLYFLQFIFSRTLTIVILFLEPLGQSSDNSTFILIGVLIGVVILILVVAAIVARLFLRKKKTEKRRESVQGSVFYMICFSSPELKAQVSFSDLSSVVCLSVCLYVCKLFLFSTSPPEPLSQFQLNLAQGIIG